MASVGEIQVDPAQGLPLRSGSCGYVARPLASYPQLCEPGGTSRTGPPSMQDMYEKVIGALDAGLGVLALRDYPSLRSTVQRLTAGGELVRLLPGVYARPDQLDDLTRLRAACAWCPQGVLHSQTAVGIWLGRSVMPAQLLCPVRRTAPVGVRATVGVVPDEFVRLHRGLRLAALSYAVVEIAPLDEGAAIMDSLRQRSIRADDLSSALAAFGGRTGNRKRTRIVRAAIRNPWSFAEAVLHRILLEAGIDGWAANAAVRARGRTYQADVLFGAERLIIEIDGYEVHSQRNQFTTDRERQNDLVLAGYRVLRFTWEHLTQHPEYVIRVVRAALQARALAAGWDA